MPALESQWEKVGPINWALAPLAGLYALGWHGYCLPFRLGFKRPYRAEIPVVCVGSLLAGGAGKSPVTLHLADVLVELGYRPVLSLSGYRSQRRKGGFAAPDGSLDAAEWGDETAQARWLRPNLPIVCGKDRVAAAKLAKEMGDLMLMDDGYQHWELAKDLSILLDPPGLANRLMIPAGNYREPYRAGLKRADLVLPSPKFQLEEAPFRLLDHLGQEVKTPKEADLLCALGRPQRFIDAVKRAGIELREITCLPDHDGLDEGNLGPKSRPLIVTGKDWMKLKRRSDIHQEKVLIAAHEVRVTPPAEFRAWLQAQLLRIRG